MATAIVLSGAGARGAYEAGVLSVVVPLLRAEGEEVVIVGTSAGAINTAVLAATAHLSVEDTVATLRNVWCTLEAEKVFKVSLLRFLPYGVEWVTAGWSDTHLYGLLDTAPLDETVDHSEYVNWEILRRNVGTTWVRAAAVTATHIARGTSVVFTQGPLSLPRDKQARGIEYRSAQLTGAHVRASAAIPIAFPCVEIPKQGFFSDGGTRLNTPISPGIDLLAQTNAPTRRLVVIGTHPDPSRPAASVKEPLARRPDVIDEGASIFHSSLIDRVAEDVEHLRRVNKLLQAAKASSVPGRRGSSYVTIPHAYFGPPKSGLIAAAARDVFSAHYHTLSPHPFSIISRCLGGKGPSRDELLSFLFFDSRFLKKVFDLGRDHARKMTVTGIPWETVPEEPA